MGEVEVIRKVRFMSHGDKFIRFTGIVFSFLIGKLLKLSILYIGRDFHNMNHDVSASFYRCTSKLPAAFHLKLSHLW